MTSEGTDQIILKVYTRKDLCLHVVYYFQSSVYKDLKGPPVERETISAAVALFSLI